jgi:hypothetical protein
MTGVLLPLALTVLAAAVTWWYCVRPARRQHGGATAGCCAAPARSLDEEIREARDELRRLREEVTPPPAVVDRPETLHR